MYLYLVRHGEALSSAENPEKRLTPLGRAEVKRAAHFLRPLDIKVHSIWHSGKTRASQTAGYLSLAVKSECGLELKGDIAPMDPVEGVAEQIKQTTANLMIVGHLPFLNKLASYLLTGNPEQEMFQFPTGGIICLSWDEERDWEVEWMLTPRIIPKEK